jgi:hypothetical protein
VEACEEKREEYKSLIKDISFENLVYIDESGIEERIVKDRGWGKKSERLAAKKSGKYYERSNIIAGFLLRYLKLIQMDLVIYLLLLERGYHF